MKTLKLALTALMPARQLLEKLMLATILILGWLTLPNLLKTFEPTAALLDAGIWQLLLLGILCYMALLQIAWWLLYRFWLGLGLLKLTDMVLQFKQLNSWQQLRFFWASFALLFLAGIACLATVL
ncbi:hypothetical protein HDC90_002159 [Pedobacter sp. AK013]|uniref:hypothetical protein n=1 Tax=Pedobacter sp. AK013 TaxID=2723071 RepID=UPI00161B3AA8|nr:hypothetical protein [Pedobacter sp. AK013]MBB6237537.1 hypothetical protein [Pedobacter sp. AK013]